LDRNCQAKIGQISGAFRFIYASCLAVCLIVGNASAQDLGTVLFDFDSDALDAQSQSQVAAIAETLKENPSYKPTIVVGYTDAVGSSDYNQGLGQRRARAVAGALTAAGVPISRIGTVASCGENDLVVAVATAERLNRRATVTLDDMMKACRSYRNIDLNPAGFGAEFQSDLQARLDRAVASYARFAADGRNGPAYQMAGAAKYDCGIAVGLETDELRKLEYGQKCFCSSARLQVALDAS
jgi:outer membrane protein OmpA-like peptidoglycan-associated protein